ncbi:MAG: carboxypeptidase regulatory-like domain-containing protein [Deltaproteobacteria bacterium]|nr:carboxypeptidase regulatory-like domain-containing protein [Nannocystaceae bacterium]
MTTAASLDTGITLDPDEGTTETKLDLGDGLDGTADGIAEAGGDCQPKPTNATLHGTVYAPNLEIPISGALVYVSTQDPEPVPDGVYCAECVGVPCDAQFVLTNADGSFELPAASGNQKLIVQKGEFLRVTDIEIAEGDNDVAPAVSSLPGEWNPGGGMWIPRIAVVNTSNDSIYNILAKIGMGSVDGGGALQPGSQQFDLLEQPAGAALLDDLDEMRRYHIIFVPCMSQAGMGNLSELRKLNIRQWVADGGKFYVTDWANEYVYETFPAYQRLNQQDFDPDLDYYDTTGTVLDPELLAWLQALPAPLKDIGGGHPNLLSLPQVELVDNWSGIDEIPPVITQDEMGDDVDVGHYPWVEGGCPTCSPTGVRPMTISADYGCGRIMFSTYHTDEGAHAGLTPQELILLYIILEIGVCHDAPPPPPPPVG